MLEEEFKKVSLVCPVCNTTKIVKIPTKIINESSNIVTISIPVSYVCEHSFQAYIDRNFSVRGYQNVDFELSELEIYETGSKLIDDVITHAVSLVIKNTIQGLKKIEEKGSIIGSAVFNQKGNVLYFSLPDEIFLNMINQFELQKGKYDINLQKMIFVIGNNQKVFAEFLDVEGTTLIIVILFPAKANLNEANLYFNKFISVVSKYDDPSELMKKEQKIMKKIEEAPKRKIVKEEPSKFWIYSKISSKKPLEQVSQIYINTLGFLVNKANILNIEDIIELSKKEMFKGKVYFSDKYANLMEGLALTMKDAATFQNKLNKEKIANNISN